MQLNSLCYVHNLVTGEAEGPPEVEGAAEEAEGPPEVEGAEAEGAHDANVQPAPPQQQGRRGRQGNHIEDLSHTLNMPGCHLRKYKQVNPNTGVEKYVWEAKLGKGLLGDDGCKSHTRTVDETKPGRDNASIIAECQMFVLTARMA